MIFAQKKELSEKEIQLLDSISLQDVPNAAPGIATAIIKNGEIIYSNVGGYANLEDSILINPSSSRFNIASNGKQFTALAILMLEHEGKLKLTDDIRKFFPVFMNGIEKPIKIEHLLSHTSGITWWEQSLNNKDIVSILLKQQDLNFTPGSGYLYSNSNYILLAQIVEIVSGKSFVAYTNNIFQLLGMKNTRFESDYLKIEEPVAKAYFNFNTWTTFKWIWNVC
jgi:CubicO group peptidase (beta-lactamase class C family)